MTRGWQLHFENYGNTDLSLNSVEIVWHGSPISANTQRVQGLIGIDENRDDLFSFSRVNETVINFLGDDPSVNRLGEVQNFVDTTHESMGENITVLAFQDANSNGVIDATDVLVDQFVTGADGNYFFDLVPGDYIIALDDDSLGELTPLDDSLTPNGFLLDYQAQWAISSDYFQVWDYDANLRVPIDAATDAPVAFLDGNSEIVEYHVNHINFLLDPGTTLAPEVVFSGQVIADVDGDGVFNGTDTVAPGIFIFGDVNRNGQFDAGEEFTSTDANGDYSLVVPSEFVANINVGAIAPADWNFTNPSSGLLSFFTQPGDTFSSVDFAIQPGVGPGVLGDQPGTIFGFVFDDDNEDGIRQTSESGISGLQVYIDNNDSGVNDAGDTVVTTNGGGAFVFTTVPVGTHKIRVDLSGNPTLQQTVPVFNFPFTVTITGGNTVTGVRFGLDNLANLDYGDLPAQYNATLFDGAVHNDLTGGARHTKGIFFLGSGVDAELNGVESADALGDNVSGTNDEDGVTISAIGDRAIGDLIERGSLIVDTNVPGGYLQGWIDFNGDGDFDDTFFGDDGLPIFERIFTNTLLPAGSTALSFRVPDVVEADTIYARFRYGEFGLGLTGLAQIGEVEDYVVNKIVTAPAVHGPDFNGDGDVDGSDFLAFQRGSGIQTNALPGNGDANEDGAVSMDDYVMWAQDFTGGTVALAAVQSGDDGSNQQLAAAIAPVVNDSISSSTIEPPYSGEHGEVATLGPRMYQPGFPEELPENVTDTAEIESTRVRRELAAVAGRVAIRSAYANRDEVAADSAENGNAQTAIRTYHARDEAFAIRQERVETRSTRIASEDDEVEALAVALDEEIDWLQI